MASATELQKGNYFMYNGEPVQLMKKEVVAYGTHSHSKLKLFVKPIYGGGEKIVTFGHTDNVQMLDIIRKTGQVISKGSGKVQVMDSKSYETFEAGIDEELYNKINENDEVIFIDLNNSFIILEKKFR